MSDDRAREFVMAIYPDAKIFCGGDGCHIQVNGIWFAYGNGADNAWTAAVHRIHAEAARD